MVSYHLFRVSSRSVLQPSSGSGLIAVPGTVTWAFPFRPGLASRLASAAYYTAALLYSNIIEGGDDDIIVSNQRVAALLPLIPAFCSARRRRD